MDYAIELIKSRGRTIAEGIDTGDHTARRIMDCRGQISERVLGLDEAAPDSYGVRVTP